MSSFLQYSELYTSLQGEGSHVGLPCFFIRTSICDIRCTWCDTPQALGKGKWISLEELLSRIPEEMPLVQITGGEPLVQKKKIIELIEILEKAPYKKKILLETGGHLSLEGIPEKTHIVMDIKLPSSKEDKYPFEKNFIYLKNTDEIKFVISDRLDFDTAINWIEKYNLENKYQLLFSPNWDILEPSRLATWLLDVRFFIRLQLQIHKVIWGKNTVGV